MGPPQTIHRPVRNRECDGAVTITLQLTMAKPTLSRGWFVRGLALASLTLGARAQVVEPTTGSPYVFPVGGPSHWRMSGDVLVFDCCRLFATANLFCGAALRLSVQDLRKIDDEFAERIFTSFGLAGLRQPSSTETAKAITRRIAELAPERRRLLADLLALLIPLYGPIPPQRRGLLLRALESPDQVGDERALAPDYTDLLAGWHEPSWPGSVTTAGPSAVRAMLVDLFTHARRTAAADAASLRRELWQVLLAHGRVLASEGADTGIDVRNLLGLTLLVRAVDSNAYGPGSCWCGPDIWPGQPRPQLVRCLLREEELEAVETFCSKIDTFAHAADVWVARYELATSAERSKCLRETLQNIEQDRLPLLRRVAALRELVQLSRARGSIEVALEPDDPRLAVLQNWYVGDTSFEPIWLTLRGPMATNATPEPTSKDWTTMVLRVAPRASRIRYPDAIDSAFALDLIAPSGLPVRGTWAAGRNR